MTDRWAGAVNAGRLVLVATPIGNLDDLAPRAARVLAEADLVCCEDTRHTGQMLARIGVRARRLRSLHQHNEPERIPELVARIETGDTVAVVSDAGTPGISDPGARLVAAVVAAGLEVTTVPGANAALAALVTSGLPTDRFCFEGFLPRKGAGRRRRLAAMAAEERTVVLHEAPGRLAATLADLAESCGPARRVAVARELTKVHEEVWRGEAGAAAAHFAGHPVRGEVVLVVGGAGPPAGVPDDAVSAAVEAALHGGASVRDAATAVAGQLGVGRRRAYAAAVELGRRNGGSGSGADAG